MRNRRNLWLLAALLLVLAGGGYYYNQQQQTQAAADVANEAPLQIATARRGSLIISATGAGTMIPSEAYELAFSTSGTLAELNATVGQLVGAGDVLATLDETDLSKAVSDAELAVAQQQLALDPATMARAIENAEIQVRLAELNVEAAQTELDDLLAWTPEADETAIAQAELNLAAAQNNLAKARSNADSPSIDVAQNQLNLNSAESNLTLAQSNATNPWLDVEQAEINLQNAKNSLASLQTQQDDPWLSVQQAQLNVQTARNNLNSLRERGPSSTAADVNSAQTNLTNAQTELRTLQQWTPDWDQVAVLQEQYRAAQESLNTARAQANVSDDSIVAITVALDNAKQSVFDAEEAVAVAYEPAREWETVSHDRICQPQDTRVCTGDTYSERIAAERENADNRLFSAQQQLEIAQANYNLAIAGRNNNQALASAEASAKSAEIALKEAQTPPDADEIRIAQDAVKQAELQLAQARDGASDTTTSYETDIKNAEAQVAQAEIALKEANLNANNSQSVDSAALQNAQAAVRQAELQLQNAQQSATNAQNSQNNSVVSAEQSVQQARLQLQLAQQNAALAASTAELDVRSAEIAVQQSRLALSDAQGGSADEIEENQKAIVAAQRNLEQSELALRQAQLSLAAVEDTSQAELNLRQAELNLVAAREKQQQSTLVAPFDGTVLAVDAQLGSLVGTTPIVTLANLEQPVVEIFLDETDINQVAIGNPVEVVFDAIPESTFTGEITQVDPQLTVDGNITTVRALATINVSLLDPGQALSVGLNAAVEVIGGQVDDGVLVPVEAIRELSPGQFAVFVMEGEDPRLRMVDVGLQDFTFAEIVSGVEAGEIVSTGLIDTE